MHDDRDGVYRVSVWLVGEDRGPLADAARTSNSLMEQLLLMDQRNELPIAMAPSIDIERSTGKLVVKLCMAGEDHLSATLAAAAIVGRLMKEGGGSPQSPADGAD